MAKQLTQEEFKKRGREAHGGWFKYDKSVYVNSQTKVCITCPEHGDFWQIPNNHYRWGGCQYCAGKLVKRSEKHLSVNSDGSVNIELASGELAIVDAYDLPLVKEHYWIKNSGYAYNNFLGLMHKHLMKTPHNKFIDHRDRDRLNNRRSNLRIATSTQNSYNKSKKEGTSSKYVGVSWNKQTGKWAAKIRESGKSRFLGRFINEDAAARAYDRAAKKYRGEFAYLNLPDER